MSRASFTTTQIRKALTACNLQGRNWSVGGETVFALYEAGDLYVGSVSIEGGRAFMIGGKWWKRHIAVFNRFAQALEALAGANLADADLCGTR